MRLHVRVSANRVAEISITEEMVERVLAEWEQEHPGGKAVRDMGEDEFARRMRIEVAASVRLLQ